MNMNYQRTIMGIFDDLVKPKADPVIAHRCYQDCVPILLCDDCFYDGIETNERHHWKDVRRSAIKEHGNILLDCDCCYEPFTIGDCDA